MYLKGYPDANRRRIVRAPPLLITSVKYSLTLLCWQVQGVASALSYMHTQTPPIVHGDLKAVRQIDPVNLLVLTHDLGERPGL